MITPRDGHVAVSLGDGRVYVVGGFDGSRRLTSGEVYDPLLDVWRPIAPMRSARDGHAAAVVNGLIIVSGGYDGATYHRTTEIYNPRTNTWTWGPAMTGARYQHSAVVLPGAAASGQLDRMVISGGSDGLGAVKLTEVFARPNPAGSSANSAPSAGAGFVHVGGLGASSSSATAASSSALFVDGSDVAVDETVLNTWTWTTGPDMLGARAGAAAVALPRQADLPDDVPDYAGMRKARAAEQRRLRRLAEEEM